MDWANAKPHIAKKIAIRIANRHEVTAPGCFWCRVHLAFSFIGKISKHPFNFMMRLKAKYVHFTCGRFPSPEKPVYQDMATPSTPNWILSESHH
jgi:hypothetical protein